jgi:hypothetical protein
MYEAEHTVRHRVGFLAVSPRAGPGMSVWRLLSPVRLNEFHARREKKIADRSGLLTELRISVSIPVRLDGRHLIAPFEMVIYFEQIR